MSKEDKAQKSPGETQTGSAVQIKQVQNVPKKKFRKVLGNYSYNEENLIGWGYTSKVYKGKSNSYPNLSVAIKKIPITDLDDLHCDLLRNETKIVKKLKHPNVVNCFDVLFTKKNCYIVMEYCQLGCLEKNFNSIDNLQQKIRVIEDICRGFRYLVSVGIVHRDIKPGNILKNNEGIWKIADFGFAADASKALTDNNISVGTPLYMAPQSLRSRRYSYHSDMFAVAIVIYQIITGGKLLWGGKNKKIILEAIMDFNLASLKVAAPFDQQFLKKMLDVKPENRPQIQKINIQSLLLQSKDKKEKLKCQHQAVINYQQFLDHEDLVRMGGVLCNIVDNTTLPNYGEKGTNIQINALLQLIYLNLLFDQIKDSIVAGTYYAKKFLRKAQKNKNLIKANQIVSDPKSKDFCENTLKLVQILVQQLKSENQTLQNFHQSKFGQVLSPTYNNWHKNNCLNNFSFTPRVNCSKIIQQEGHTLRETLICYKNLMERICKGNLNRKKLSDGTIPIGVGLF